MSFRSSRNLKSPRLAIPDYFNYEPLQDLTKDIRLLNLLPGREDEKIKIEVFNVSLCEPIPGPKQAFSQRAMEKTLPQGWEVRETVDRRLLFSHEVNGVTTSTWTHPKECLDAAYGQRLDMDDLPFSEPSFEALSYVWGPQNNGNEVNVVPRYSSTGTILKRGGFLAVGPALSVALRHLRWEKKMRTLWIDAICINQDDKTEREEQVRRMGGIYRLAKSVIVWLGPATVDSRLALSTLEHLGCQIEITLDGVRVASPDAEYNTWYDERIDLPFSTATWKSIYELLDRRWFKRLWILQEIALANRFAVVQCGGDIIPFALFRRSVICLYGKNNLPFKGLRQLVLEAVRISEDHHGKTLMSLFENSRLQECSDPKDRVYGILGMAPKGFANLIHPNYSEKATVQDTYCDFFLSHLRHFRRWELFACEKKNQKINGPSWVPDWTSLNVPGWGSRQQFSSGHSRIHFEYRASNILDVTGLRVATVTHVCEAVETNDPEIDLKTVRGWEPKELKNREYATGDSLLDAYAITLLQHRIRDRWPKNAYMPTLEEWKSQTTAPAEFGEQAWAENSSAGFDRANSLSNRAYNCVLGRALVLTQEGYIGLAPVATQPGQALSSEIPAHTIRPVPTVANDFVPGDIISIFLGCDPPMVLRPEPEGRFQLVGSSFVYGLNDATALLGPIPKPWKVQLFRYRKSMFREVYSFFNPDTGEVTAEDPRLRGDPVWKRVHVEDIGRDLTPDDPTICDFFRNEKTGLVMDSDPRLLPDALKEVLQAQGKKLEVFSLV